LTPKAEELVADYHRHGSKEDAKSFFESGMSEVMASIAKSQAQGVPATLFYAFKATEVVDGDVVSTGWDTFLQAVIDAGLMITATWPLRTEMPGGARMAGRNVLSTSVVLACRTRDPSAPIATRSEFIERLRQDMPVALATLQTGNISPVDLAQSAMGPGIRIFSQYSRVIEADGRAMPVRLALVLVNEVVSEAMDGGDAELDEVSRFAIAWYTQHGYEGGAFGDADGLSRAKNTSVQAIVDSGVGVVEGGRFRLLERGQLETDWSPLTDERLTVWEGTQHLIRTLEESETDAAQMLAAMAGFGDRARELGYLLFQKATDHGWAQWVTRTVPKEHSCD